MKIVNRQQFLQMPSGTLYREYEPCAFGDLQVKGNTWPHRLANGTDASDHIAAHFDCVESEGSVEAFDILDRAAETGESFNLDYDESWMRDGWSPEINNKLYAVYERADVEQLIEFLGRVCLK